MDMTTTDTSPRTEAARPVGLVSVDGRAYPLKSAKIDARAEGGIAATTFTQVYANPYEEPLEVLYTLPLPADGAVTGYSIRLGKLVIRGEVRKREEAREEYRKALLDGRTAALLEQERADTFSQKLGSLPPGETAEVEIEVLQRLAFLPAENEERARWEYRFPTVAGIRYEGAEGRVPDAEKLDVNRAADGTPVRLEANLDIADGPADEIQPHAPGQQIRLEASTSGTRVVLGEKMKLDRDLVIRWTVGNEEIGLRAVEGKGLCGDSGRYFLITLTPPTAVRKAVRRDLTLLLDASGSMSGAPLEQAKVVASELLHSLDPGDRFEILAFANEARQLLPGPVEAGEKNIRKALEALKKLQASGSTEMAKALVEALKPLRADSQRQVILLSDGYIGFESEVIGEISRRLVPGARVHVVGIGTAPNRTLTRGAARAGRGVEILVGDQDDAGVAARRLLQATIRPVLTDIEVRGTGVISVAPRKPRDVLEGQPLVLLAEVRPKGGSIEVKGRAACACVPWVRRLEIPELRESPEGEAPDAGGMRTSSLPLGALFGRETIEDVELDLAAAGRDGGSGKLEKEIERLGLRHGIASRMTSLIAISEDPTVDPKDPRRRERLAVEVPAGVSAEGVGLMPCAAPLAFADICGEAMLMEPVALKRRSPVRLLRSLLHREMPPSPPSGPMVIEQAHVLNLDGQILVFEFEVPVDGFLLPHDGMKVHVSFEGEGSCSAQVLGHDSSKPGPHEAGLIVRLALRLEDHLSWAHRSATILWPCRLQWYGKEVESGHVELRLSLERGR
jgi:Ca-activated chloride channel family protein